MTDGEEVLDCMLSVDEMLSEAEEALEEKKYATALHKIKEARDMIEELREDDEAADDRQEVDMHMSKIIK
jgi:flagellin-specific chaperone FliS